METKLDNYHIGLALAQGANLLNKGLAPRMTELYHRKNKCGLAPLIHICRKRKQFTRMIFITIFYFFIVPITRKKEKYRNRKKIQLHQVK